MKTHFLKKIFFSILLLLLSGCNTHNSLYQFDNNLTQLYPQYAPINNGKMEYYQTGHGSPVVLIPGYATDVSSWDRKFIATLALKHHVIILNNRGVGGSYNYSDSYDTRDLANDTYQLIQNLKLNKPTIIGISMGGMIAQQLAVLHEDVLGSLILINTSIAGEKSIHPTPVVEKQLVTLPKNKLGFYFSAIHLFFPPQWQTRMAYSLISDRFQPQNINEINADKIIPKQQELIRNWLRDNETAHKIATLQLPTLVLNGKSDIVIPPRNSIMLANTIPHAKLIQWNEGGHAIIYQYPYDIANVINNFISKGSDEILRV